MHIFKECLESDYVLTEEAFSLHLSVVMYYLGVVKSMSVMLMRSPRCSSMRHGQVSEP